MDWLQGADAPAAGGGDVSPLPPSLNALLLDAASLRLEALTEGGPHAWGILALLGWIVWLLAQGAEGGGGARDERCLVVRGQRPSNRPSPFFPPSRTAAPWRALLPALRGRPLPPPAPAWGWRRDPAPLVLRLFWYGCASSLLWISHLDPRTFQVKGVVWGQVGGTPGTNPSLRGRGARASGERGSSGRHRVRPSRLPTDGSQLTSTTTYPAFFLPAPAAPVLGGRLFLLRPGAPVLHRHLPLERQASAHVSCYRLQLAACRRRCLVACRPLARSARSRGAPARHSSLALTAAPPAPPPCPVPWCSGWLQAFVLWNFVISTALLLQKYVILLGLGGLLPGERGGRPGGRGLLVV